LAALVDGAVVLPASVAAYEDGGAAGENGGDGGAAGENGGAAGENGGAVGAGEDALIVPIVVAFFRFFRVSVDPDDPLIGVHRVAGDPGD
jgi:hypothetical protein